ncbi:uncharacterized protein HGUI_03207 [Hanseniaspora guilliermondii]|uniref:Uncharacterized protein n=1 Tax=Hanseniaspora guilliermondii TaxID=56406 RepID=A0A1L0D1J5_9ASCO|nr:uncharacterized protein HGUI_03207 [Hanseniaspora guilliermondii]
MTNKDSTNEDLLPRYNKDHTSEKQNTQTSIKWLTNVNNRIDNSVFVNKSKTLKNIKKRIHILYALISILLMLLMILARLYTLSYFTINDTSKDPLFVPQNIDYKPDHILVTQEIVMVNNDEIIKDSKVNMEKAKEMLLQKHNKDNSDYNSKKESSHKGNDIKALKQSDDDKKFKENKKQNNEPVLNEPPFKKNSK